MFDMPACTGYTATHLAINMPDGQASFRPDISHIKRVYVVRYDHQRQGVISSMVTSPTRLNNLSGITRTYRINECIWIFHLCIYRILWQFQANGVIESLFEAYWSWKDDISKTHKKHENIDKRQMESTLSFFLSLSIPHCSFILSVYCYAHLDPGDKDTSCSSSSGIVLPHLLLAGILPGRYTVITALSH